MTATDPRPELAAKLAAGLVPAAEALALAYAEDMSAGPPPPDDRAIAEHHRAGRAQLSHLRQLLSLLDWAGKHLPEPDPEPEEQPADEFDNPFGEPDPVASGYDGSEERPGFREWSEDMERRFGPLVPDADDYDGSRDEEHYGDRKYVGKFGKPEHRAWLERQDRREIPPLAPARSPGLAGRPFHSPPPQAGRRFPDGRLCRETVQDITPAHGEHDRT